MGYLASMHKCNGNLETIVQEFVSDLPQVLLSEKVSQQHLKLIQVLLNRNDIALITSLINVLPTFPGKFAKAIDFLVISEKKGQKSIMIEVWKTVALIILNPSIASSAKMQNEYGKWKHELLNISDKYGPDDN